jgi:hypothetical protein
VADSVEHASCSSANLPGELGAPEPALTSQMEDSVLRWPHASNRFAARRGGCYHFPRPRTGSFRGPARVPWAIIKQIWVQAIALGLGHEPDITFVTSAYPTVTLALFPPIQDGLKLALIV